MAYEAAGEGTCIEPMNDRRTFGRRHRSARLAAGFATARMFAQALGLAENRYTRYERDETEPALATITRICQLLGSTPDELLGFEPPATVDIAAHVDTLAGPLATMTTALGPARDDDGAEPRILEFVSPQGSTLNKVASSQPAASPAASPSAARSDLHDASRLRWRCWQLARECVAIELPPALPHATLVATKDAEKSSELTFALHRLQRTCEMFREIELDPCGFIAATVERGAFEDLPADSQQRLTAAIEAVSAVLAETPLPR